MQRVGFLALPGFQLLSAAALSVFELASKERGEPVYELRLLSETGGPIRSSIGVDVATEPFDERKFDTLLVGGSSVTDAVTPGVIKFLRRALRRYRRGPPTRPRACLLAEAGPPPRPRAPPPPNPAPHLQAPVPAEKGGD